MAADESNDNLISVANGLISGSSRHLTNAWFQLQDASALFFAIFFFVEETGRAFALTVKFYWNSRTSKRFFLPFISMTNVNWHSKQRSGKTFRTTGINSTVDIYSTQNLTTVFADIKYNSTLQMQLLCVWKIRISLTHFRFLIIV